MPTLQPPDESDPSTSRGDTPDETANPPRFTRTQLAVGGGVAAALVAILAFGRGSNRSASTPDANHGDAHAAVAVSTDSAPADGACEQDQQCDDGQPCTRDTCGVDARCLHVPTPLPVCLPSVELATPAAMQLIGVPGSTVTVAGRAQTGIGDVQRLQLNGAAVDVAPDGAFSVEVGAQVGANTLSFVVTDSNRWTGYALRSFVWASEYIAQNDPAASEPAPAMEDAVLVVLGEPAIEELERTAEAALNDLDLNPLTPAGAIASKAGYDVYVERVEHGDATVSLELVDGGMQVHAAMKDIRGALRFDCTQAACVALGGDSSGRIGLKSIAASATLKVSERDGAVEATPEDLDVAFGALSLSSRAIWTRFLLSTARSFVEDRAVAEAKRELESQIEQQLGKRAASRPSIARVVALSADTTKPIDVGMRGQLQALTISTTPNAAVRARLSTTVSSTKPVIDRPILGVPRLAGCGVRDWPLETPGKTPLELAISDTLLNQLLVAAWRGGMLELALGDSAVTVSSALPMLITDCHSGAEPRADLVGLTVEQAGPKRAAVASFAVTVAANAEGVTVTLGELKSLTLERGADPQADAALESIVRAHLPAALRQRTALSLTWPELSIPLPDGAVALTVDVDGVNRRPGSTIVLGRVSGPP